MTISDTENAGARLYFYGAASMAKSVIFRSLAHQALAREERIWAVICGYYSLLHLTLALMYLCPQMLQKQQRERLLRIAEGGADPSEAITHDAAYNFAVQCKSKGLNHADLLYRGKSLREFVNYGPRMSLIGDVPIFVHAQNQPSECDAFISKIDETIVAGVEWAHKHSPLFLSYSSLHQMWQFFNDDDLFYVDWCSYITIVEAREFLKRLEQTMER